MSKTLQEAAAAASRAAPPPPVVRALTHSVSGAVAGIGALTLTYPLLTVTTRMQVQGRKGELHMGGYHYDSALQGIMAIVDKEGWKQLFAGLKSACIGMAATQAVYYYWYELLKAMAVAAKPKLSTMDNIAIAAGAGCVTAVATNPIWLVNTRLQTRRREPRTHLPSEQEPTMWSVGREVIARDGVLGLWKGIGPALALVGNPTVQYAAFERLRLWVEVGLKPAGAARRRITPLQVFLLGAVAKVLATIVTYPMLVVKTRMYAKKEARSRSPVEVALSVLRSKGAMGFYEGLSTKMMQSVLTAALLFLGKERVFKLTMALLTRLHRRLAR